MGPPIPPRMQTPLDLLLQPHMGEVALSLGVRDDQNRHSIRLFCMATYPPLLGWIETSNEVFILDDSPDFAGTIP